MEFLFVVFSVVVATVHGGALMENDMTPDCNDLYYSYNLSPNLNETIAHAIHSMTVQGLRMYNPRATEFNTVPTVNHDIKDEVRMTHILWIMHVIDSRVKLY